MEHQRHLANPTRRTDIRSIVGAAVAGFDGNQAALALELGVTRATVSRWMSGQSIPGEGSCLRLAKITGHTAIEVFRSAGRDTSLVQTAPESMTDAELPVRLRRWAHRLAEMSESNRAIALSVVDDVLKALSEHLGERETAADVSEQPDAERHPRRRGASMSGSAAQSFR